MGARSWLLVWVSLGCTSACLVSSFEVTENTGGTSSGGMPATAGRGGNGTTTGGTTSLAGQTEVGGMLSAGGEPDGPYRVGYSMFQDSASGGDGHSASQKDATFAVPANTREGDLMLVFFGADHSLQNLDNKSLGMRGWMLQAQRFDYGTDGQATYLAYRFAGASEPSSIVFNDINVPPTTGNGVQGLLSVYRGIHPTAPVNAFEMVVETTGESNLTDVTTPTPTITTTVDGCLLIAGLSPDSGVDAPTIAMWPAGFDTNQVSLINPQQSEPFGWANIYSAEQVQARAGKLQASSFVWHLQNTTEYYGSLSFVLALAPAR